ncbi:hypothetical protein ElyMa_006474000 [Elysia marginata]|uniref:Endonuclease/exonuclease/phosphatase domain-containing protein n=1 Tax=Elysia marginata TaxID=1093978 RepID=A0AAV4I210_9GAST|nr:hypothetical protein ElyMa_006474000 [Elysia marginata]
MRERDKRLRLFLSPCLVSLERSRHGDERKSPVVAGAVWSLERMLDGVPGVRAWGLIGCECCVVLCLCGLPVSSYNILILDFHFLNNYVDCRSGDNNKAQRFHVPFGPRSQVPGPEAVYDIFRSGPPGPAPGSPWPIVSGDMMSDHHRLLVSGTPPRLYNCQDSPAATTTTTWLSKLLSSGGPSLPSARQDVTQNYWFPAPGFETEQAAADWLHAEISVQLMSSFRLTRRRSQKYKTKRCDEHKSVFP